METVLHIEPIVRQTPAPLDIGYTDYLFYGETLSDEGENIGTPSSQITLGCPLEQPDYGSTRSHIPLVKTIDYMPDPHADKGHVYTETLHYLTDKKILIPYRTKIRSGLKAGSRITHLPSLNAVRKDIVGLNRTVMDPRSEIVSDTFLRDQMTQHRNNKPLHDWIADELNTHLSWQTTNDFSFDTTGISHTIERYVRQIHSTPHEFSGWHLREICDTIAPSHHFLPSRYRSQESLGFHLHQMKDRLIPNTYDFQSLGTIPVDALPLMEYNPKDFREICEYLDTIPLTDFNIDVVINADNEIHFYHEHIALNRFGVFADNEFGKYSAETILLEYLEGPFLGKILDCFLRYHRTLTDEVIDTISQGAVKIKLMKTLSDEAAVLLYPYNSASSDPPLCGVYFDMALLALAPMTIMPEPLWN